MKRCDVQNRTRMWCASKTLIGFAVWRLISSLSTRLACFGQRRRKTGVYGGVLKHRQVLPGFSIVTPGADSIDKYPSHHSWLYIGYPDIARLASILSDKCLRKKFRAESVESVLSLKRAYCPNHRHYVVFQPTTGGLLATAVRLEQGRTATRVGICW